MLAPVWRLHKKVLCNTFTKVSLVALFLVLSLLIGATLIKHDVTSAAAESFTVIALPDTQFYSESYPEIFNAQTQWIVNNKNALNIVYVAHEGDIVELRSSVEQWERASAAMGLLENPVTTGLTVGIPYGVVPGNHDEHPLYNTYFGPPRFAGRSYYGGEYPSGDNSNNYTLFSAFGMDFIVVNLDYEEPAPGNLDWADNLLKTYSNRRAIVVSHYILTAQGNFGSWGQQIYDALKDNPNLFLTLSGHVGNSESRRTDVFNGNTVYSLMADFQSKKPQDKGGNGWLRIMEFSPSTNEIRVKTYSPYLNQWQTEAESQFTLAYDMSNAATPTPTVSPTPTPTPDPFATSTPTPTPTPTQTTLVFDPIADATIKKSYPDKNYGTSAYLEVDNRSVEQYLIKFNLTGINNRQVIQAKLRLYCTNPSTGSGGTFYKTSDTSWIESGAGGVTWNTAPVADATPSANLGPVTSGYWYEVDLTSVITGNGLVGFRATSASDDGADYSSKEANTNKPQLIVTVQ